MRNQKIKHRGLVILAWSGAILLAAYLLVINGIVMGEEEPTSNQDTIGCFAEGFSRYLLKNSVPLVEYTTLSPYYINTKNPILKHLIKISPISMYVLAHEEKTTEASTIEVETLEEEMIGQSVMEENIKVNQLPAGAIGYIFGETYHEQIETEENATETMALSQNKVAQLMKNLEVSYLLENFYIINSTTTVNREVFNVKELLQKNFQIKKKEDKPQILIYHTHATTEAFADSRKGKTEDTVVGVGRYLAKLLTEVYGYEVIHDETEYDKVNGVTDRDKAYNYALPGLKKTLKENPSILVMIDLHRDGVNGTAKRTVMINGKETAQIMFFNGLSRSQSGAIAYLKNPRIQENLAFSLQLKLKAMKKYPDFTRANFLKGYRYNLHLRDRSLLIELGNQNNTVEEAKNAMEPFANILDEILTGIEE